MSRISRESVAKRVKLLAEGLIVVANSLETEENLTDPCPFDDIVDTLSNDIDSFKEEWEGALEADRQEREEEEEDEEDEEDEDLEEDEEEEG